MFEFLLAATKSTTIAARDRNNIPGSIRINVRDQLGLPVSPANLDFLCGRQRCVALTLIGDLTKRNFAEKHHII